MKSFVTALATVLLCWSSSDARADIRIVTTTTDLAALAQAVGGDTVSVEPLTRGTRDPHFAAARPSMIRKIFRADLLLLIGADLEIGWLPAALKAGRNSKVLPGGRGYLDLSTAVKLIGKPTGPVTRAMGDVHAKGNPHYWLDPNNGRMIAKALAERFEKLDPSNAAVYRSRLAAFERRLDEKISSWRALFANIRGKSILSHHKTFSYFARAFGFRVVGYVEPLPGIAPSAAHIEGLIERVKRERIGVLIMAPYYNRRAAQLLNDRTKIKVVVLPQSVGAAPGIESYTDLFDAITTAFGKAGVI